MGRHNCYSLPSLQEGSAVPEETQLSLLFLLPAGVLAKHVWPHLGSWACTQLRATCRQLHAVADGALQGMVSCTLEPEQLAGKG
jgi:hypothetical protein